MAREVVLSQLEVGKPLDNSLFSANGVMLMKAGRVFKQSHLDAIVAAGIQSVIIPDPGELDEECSEAIRFRRKNIEDLGSNDILGYPIIDSSSRLLAQAGTKLDSERRTTLARQGIKDVYVLREFDSALDAVVKSLAERLSRIAIEEARTEFGRTFKKHRIDAQRYIRPQEEISVGTVVSAAKIEIKRPIRFDLTVRNLIEPPKLLETPSAEHTAHIRRQRNKHLRRVGELFAKIRDKRKLDNGELGICVRSIVTNFVSDRFHRLHISHPGESFDYLVAHSFATAVLAVHMAGRLNFALDEIYEMAYCALLHDVGMMRVSEDILEKREALTQGERDEVWAHPRYGIDMMQGIRNLPRSVPLIMYQENERLNGSGYPRGIKSDQIHPYARIIAVAATYDALTRHRPWRSALHPHHAMTVLLQEVKSGRLDSVSVRSLLQSLSLFPIGSEVQINDGRTGMVLDASGDEFARPVIAVKRDETGKLLTREIVIDLQNEVNRTTSVVKMVTANP